MKKIVEKYLGSYDHVEQGGTQYFYNCPECGHHRFTINYDKNVFRCWKCGYSSKSIISLLFDLNASYTDIQKIKEHLGIKDYYGGGDKSLQEKIDKILFFEEETKDTPIHEQRSWISLFTKSIFVTKARKYLYSRGVSDYEIRYYNIKYDRDTAMLVFPSYDIHGNLNFYVKRNVGHDYSYYENCDRSKKNIIFYESLIDFTRPVNIVEGIFDVFKVGDNTIPLLGSLMTNRLYRLLVAFETPEVNIMMDPDAKDSMIKMGEKLSTNGVNTNIIVLEGDQDPSDKSKTEIKKLLTKKRKHIDKFSLIEANLEYR